MRRTLLMTKIISVLFTFILLIFIFSISLTLQAQTGESWQASKETVEKLSKSTPGFNYYEEKVPAYTLPPAMTAVNGKKISTKDDWLKIRRPELMELFRTNVYGRIPSAPYKMDFKVINQDTKAINGSATMKQVDITISAEKESLIIHLNLFLPNNIPKPVPVFLLICNRSSDNIDPTRKVKSEFWPAEEVIARGYGIAAFSNADIDPDNFDEFRNGIHGIMDKVPRPDDAWGTLAAWGWGASRCMDYFVSDKDIAKDKVAVVGHSRGGKTALWAGAEDQRFAMVVSNESGAGGAAIARRQFGETVSRLNTSFPHWFCTNYRKYNNNEDTLPVDTHELLALVAPRALYIACASEDLWGDPKGCYLALYNSLPVFRLLGIKSELPQAVPPLDKQIINGEVAFHIRSGEHGLKLQDWNFFMDFADKVMK
jgi:hypothetical protein